MRRAFLFWELVFNVAGCVLPMRGGGRAAQHPADPAAAAETIALAPPVVQVRDFPGASVVSVLAFEAADATLGLRTEVSRNGTLVGGDRFGDHRLYLTPFHAWYMGGFAHAIVVPGQPLVPVGSGTDPYSCFYGTPCAPMSTVGVRLPDALLRAKRDSLVVTFLPISREPWTITLRGALISAYLAVMDSVVAERRTRASRASDALARRDP